MIVKSRNDASISVLSYFFLNPDKNLRYFFDFTFDSTTRQINLPSLGIVRIGICVIEPFLPSTRPALYKEKQSKVKGEFTLESRLIFKD